MSRDFFNISAFVPLFIRKIFVQVNNCDSTYETINLKTNERINKKKIRRNTDKMIIIQRNCSYRYLDDNDNKCEINCLLDKRI